MYHLTRNHKKLLRKNGSKVMLSLCVAMALSGGLVSAEGKTYDYVNPWASREALEGDTIEVKYMSGGDGKLQAGTDETGKVTVHALWTYGDKDSQLAAVVKGKKITIGDQYPDEKGNPISTANWGGTMSIGGDTTESVTMEGFRTSGSYSKTNIKGGSISMGSLDNWGSTVTINADGNFKVVKGDNLQDIGVTGGGRLTVHSGSFRANRLSIANEKSSAEISGKEGIYFSNGLSVNDNSKVEMASPSIRVEGDSSNGLVNISSQSSVKLGGNDLFVTGGLNIANSTLTAAETGTLELGKKDAYNCFTVTNSQVSLGSETSQLHLYGNIRSSVSSQVDIHGQEILIDGVHISNNSSDWTSTDSILTNNDVISVGDNDSNVWLKGRLFNTGSDVTVNGRTIHISVADVINSDAGKGKYSQYAIEGTGDDKTKTTIGNENTESLLIDGATWINHGSLWMNGKNIDLSYAKGIALIGSNHEYDNPSKGTRLLAGRKETENLTIKGQVANIGAAEMQLSGQHITIDSTGYDGSENRGQYPESLLALSNDIHAGTKDTQTISISSGLNALGGNIQVLGKDITVGTSGYFKTHKVEVWDEVNKKYIVFTDNIAHAADGNVTIGSDDTDTVHLYGGQLLANGTRNNNIHGYITIQGHDISIDGNDQWAGWTNKGTLIIGTDDSDSVRIRGGIHAESGIPAEDGGAEAAVIKGKNIYISSNDVNRYALEGIGGNMEVGDSATESVNVDGGIHANGSTISLKGKGISISRGKQGNAIYTDGGTGTVIVKAAGGNTAHISGPIRNKYGKIDISLTGGANHLDSQIITGKYDKNGKFIDAYGAVMNLGLSNKASWNPSGNNKDSNFTTYTGDDGIIHLDNETHQTVTISEFNDKGTRIHEDIYGSKNTGNDTIHIDNSYTGNTHFWLVNRDDTDKGVVGTVLASALKKNAGSTNGAKALMILAAMPAAAPAADPDPDPIADFEANHFAAYGMNSLFFKTYGLRTKDSDRADTQDYTKDLYITGVTNHVTNDKGQYTPTVSAAFSGSSLMYYTWRTENDKMLQRVGDLRENEGEETGLWTRIRGSRIGRNGYRGFKNQYKVYEIGYDAKTEDNDRMKSFTGIALSYLDGKGYYADGQGTNQATSAAIYHTDIHKTGHYLDLVFRIRHMNERFHTRDTVDTDIGPVTEDHSASLDTTGLSFSAEYGRKKFMGKGWYVEPQTQWTLGYLGPVQYEMDNGTRVEQPGITSFVGRAGFNLGRQVNENSIVYLKANVYHEFGGHSPLHLYAGDESLSFTDTFDDTWFEYGVGFAVKLGNGLSLYGDVEKTAGSHFYKDWQWNAGLRYSF